MYRFSTVKMMGCGMVGGFFASQISCPSERVKCIMQQNTCVKSPSSALRHILHKEGISGLYKGMTFTLFRDMSAYGAFFVTLHSSREMFESIMPNKMTADIIIGGAAGTGFWLAALPGDRLKSTYQADLDGKYNNVVHLTKSILQVGFN